MYPRRFEDYSKSLWANDRVLISSKYLPHHLGQLVVPCPQIIWRRVCQDSGAIHSGRKVLVLHSFVDPLDGLEQTPFNTATERTRDVIEVGEWESVNVNNHMTSPPHVIQVIVWAFQSGSLISEEYLI
ncbi:MAG: hypothetical protein Q9168_004981 [Polycauliona sp. 1 TL-2023]